MLSPQTPGAQAGQSRAAPQPGLNPVPAQYESQDPVQQNESQAHTVSQQVLSAQPPVALATQQSFGFGGPH
jgi:hypothetical protein